MTGAAAVAPSSGPIPRPPVLKGLHYALVKRNLFVAIGASLVITAAWKVAFNDPKKRDYAEFYKNYDPKKSFERMRKAGHLQSAAADN